MIDFELISQIMLFISGGAIWFMTRKEHWKRWGYIIGICGQPFWLYTSINSKQWGIIILTIFYTYSFAQGIYFYWKKIYFNFINL